jgi:hypothetical protein
MPKLTDLSNNLSFFAYNTNTGCTVNMNCNNKKKLRHTINKNIPKISVEVEIGAVSSWGSGFAAPAPLCNVGIL